ncbi:YafY family transcriptional regulator [Paenibacillus sp. GSMTC-2017]|uniref:helix-turn-helix transcriptional regulator n=1 Tax=Paenibacillus sp. GSMTC-2017 TaxID=2794350 RepID=UPI0018D93912|nr:YafY family protein [Paenibacillus sp. GSMTC-2017]MBH5319057.1 YafY family transcriptional regulator [Paenibacillus sp. GSMTC-2017]
MKLERLISMIYMLLNNEILSASELAEKYGVSQRTIYRDIETICAAGIPVVSYQGVNGGYGIIEEYKMDKSLLGSYDVGSLVSVLQSISSVFQDDKATETIRRLQTIQGSEQNAALSMDIGSRPVYRKSLQLLRDAIESQTIVHFCYINAKNERVERSVEPLKLLYKFESWYLQAYCRTRNDYREFKLSRVTDLRATALHFHNDHQKNVMEPPDQVFPERLLKQVVVRISPSSLARALDSFHMAERQFHEDGSLTLRMQVDEYAMNRWLIHVILSFGEDAEIIEPPALRAMLKFKLEKMLVRYDVGK